MKKYRATTGLNYPDPKRPGTDPKTGKRHEKRVEAGEIVDDIPDDHWYVREGIIVPLEAGEKKGSAESEE